MTSPERSKTSVTWIPAHPIYGAVSMRRYWQKLDESRRADDRFQIQSLIHPTDIPIPSGVWGMAARYWHRNIAYPALLRRNFTGTLAHVLDHSWADMLPHTPPGTLKIATVHDLIPLRFPGELSPSQKQRFRTWINHLTQADAIISVSHYTKQEIQHFLPVPGEKIRVIPCGVDLPDDAVFETPVNTRYAPPGTVLLGSIGSTITRKNLSILPDALGRLRATTGRKISLIRVGAKLPAALAEELRKTLGEDGLVELGHLSDQEVGDFYRSMDAVVVPSLYEGFGLPVLESLAWGTPVVSSNATSLPEVGGEEALYFDPNSPAELAARLEEIITGQLPSDWRSKARARASGFSWRSSLEQIFAIYEAVIDQARTAAPLSHP